VAPKRAVRVLIAEPGLNGHDLEVKVAAHALRDAGFEIIYTGLSQTVEMIVQSAIQEDVDVIGLSIRSGAHMPICEKLFTILKGKGVDDVMVLVVGVIPTRDIEGLKKMGVAEVFPDGSDVDAPAEFIRKHICN
jgi:methylmalonyl-CoA mutase, C-terminal domain